MSCVICCERLFDNIGRLSSNNSKSRPPSSNANWQDQPSVLSCGHVFHQACIGAWLAQSNKGTCPTCRSQQKGDPIALYFEVDEVDSSPLASPAARDHDSPQVTHRNKIIKTLCANVEAAQAETKTLREQYKALELKLSIKQLEHADEVSKSQKHKAEATSAKNSAERRKLRIMKLEGEVAEKENRIERLESQVAQLKAELQEQIQVVKGMCDVRSTNEQLVRSLKKERSRNSTLNTLNQQFAAKVAAFSKASANSSSPNANQAQELDATDRTAKDGALLISDHETDLDDEGPVPIDKTTSSVWNRPNAAKAATKLASTFDIPVSRFSKGKLADSSSTSSSSSSTSVALQPQPQPQLQLQQQQQQQPQPPLTSRKYNSATKNPFAVQVEPKGAGMPKKFTFSMDVDSDPLIPLYMMAQPDISKQNRRIKPLRAKSLKTVSDGMGGSRSAFSSRGSSFVQGKISWTAKKQ